MREEQSRIDETSQDGEQQEVDGATKLDLWKEVAGGKSRGRCYGTADLASNIRHGVSSLTQESRAPSDLGTRDVTAENDMLRRQVLDLSTKVNEANEKYSNLEGLVQEMAARMRALEQNQSVGASTSASQAVHRHPDYDEAHDEDSLDEDSPRRPRRRC